jgi:hypothetical protein
VGDKLLGYVLVEEMLDMGRTFLHDVLDDGDDGACIFVIIL